MKSDLSYRLDYTISSNPPSDDEPPRPEEQVDSQIKAELTDSRTGHETKLKVYYNHLSATEFTNGSVKLIFPDEFDLSALARDDLQVVGGSVNWSSETRIFSHGQRIAAKQFMQLIQPAYAEGENSIIFPFSGGFGGSDQALEFIIGNANQLINPLNTGVYDINLQLMDETGEIKDSREAKVVILDNVTVTATIPSQLTFTIDPVEADQSINGQLTTNGTANGNEVGFGDIFGAVDLILAHDLIVSTNASNGYSVTVSYDQIMKDENEQTIPDFVGTNNSPRIWEIPPGHGVEGYFGYTTSDDFLHDTINNRFTSNRWSGFSAIPQEVAYDSDPTDDQSTRIGYRLNLTDLQAAGFYQTRLMYICTPSY